MSDAGYVIAGWTVAAVVLGGYTFQLLRRVRRAEAADTLVADAKLADTVVAPDGSEPT